MHAYERVAQELASEIEEGDYLPGTALPTLPELMDRFGVSRATIRQGIDELARMGLVFSGYVDGRRGTIVRARDRIPYYVTDGEKARADRRDCFAFAAERSGKAPSSRFEMRWCVPPEEVRTRLGTGADELVVARISRQFLNGEPWSVETTYYPSDIAKKGGVDVPHDLPQGSILTIMEAGIVPVAHVDEIIDVAATHDVAQSLDVPVGTPVIIQMCTSATAERVVMLNHWVRLGGKVRMIWERKTGPEEQAQAALQVISRTRGEDAAL